MSTNPIPPALTAEQWDSIGTLADILISPRIFVSVDKEGKNPRLFIENHETDEMVGVDTEALPGFIAAANAALPDSDDRKITRQLAEDIRFAGREVHLSVIREYGADKSNWGLVPVALEEKAERLDRFARVLESYLPPERGAGA